MTLKFKIKSGVILNPNDWMRGMDYEYENENEEKI